MDSIIIFCAKDLLALVVIGLVVAWLVAPKSQRLRFAVTTVVAGIIALLLSRIASHLYYDPRPFVAQHVKPLFGHAADNGFPSDHSLLAMALTTVVYFFNKKIAAVMLVATILIGVARVVAHVHSPIDIIGAWALAIIGAAAGYYLVGKFVGPDEPGS